MFKFRDAKFGNTARFNDIEKKVSKSKGIQPPLTHSDLVTESLYKGLQATQRFLWKIRVCGLFEVPCYWSDSDAIISLNCYLG